MSFNFDTIPPSLKKRGKFIESLKQGLLVKAGTKWLPTHKSAQQFSTEIEPTSFKSEHIDIVLQKVEDLISSEFKKPSSNGTCSRHTSSVINRDGTNQEILSYKWLDTESHPKQGILGIYYENPKKGRIEITPQFIYGLVKENYFSMPTPPEISKKISSIFSRTPNKYKGSSVSKEVATGAAEDKLREKMPHARWVIGLDEAGRGSWAGPLVSGAFLMDLNNPPTVLDRVKDSKALTQEEIKEINQELKQNIYGIGSVSAQEICKLGNLNDANKLAFIRAIQDIESKFKGKIDHILVDGTSIEIKDIYPNSTCIAKGERTSKSIAAGSIIGKNFHDREMERLHEMYPEWNFKDNVGYGTPTHKKLLERHGICPEHRTTFKPVKAALEKALRPHNMDLDISL